MAKSKHLGIPPAPSTSSFQSSMAAPILSPGWGLNGTANTCPQKVLYSLKQLVNPDARTKFGRAFQIVQVMFLSTLAFAGILVQVYTDIETSYVSNNKGAQMQAPFTLLQSMYELVENIREESRVYFLFNGASNDIFMAETSPATRATDSKLLMMEDWPTTSDLSKLPTWMRENVTSAETLSQAMRNQRNLKRIMNMTEDDVLNFYYGLTNALTDIARTIILRIPRFPGWSELLAYHNFFEMEGQAQRLYRIGRKFIEEKRKVNSRDPIYKKFIIAQSSYDELVAITGLDSKFTRDQINNNYTQQDGVRAFLASCTSISNLVYKDESVTNFDNQFAATEAAIEWLKNLVMKRITAAVKHDTATWGNFQVVSIVLLVISSFLAVCAIMAHFIGVWRLQIQMYEDNKKALVLDKLMAILYDCVPRSMVTMVKAGRVMAPRESKEFCVLMVDVNTSSVMENLQPDQLAEFITSYYLTVEQTVAKYNCFKVAIIGDIFCLGAGAGEPHDQDYVMEMVFMALELQDRVAELLTGDLRLRVGIHVGPGVSQILFLNIPRMCIFGEVVEVAALIHATSLPLKVQASAAVYQRMVNCPDVEFIRRGTLNASSVGDVIVYWASWAMDDEEDYNDLLSRASTPSLMEPKDEEDEHEDEEKSETSP